LEGLGVIGRIILKCVFKNWKGIMDYIELAQNRDSFWALENVVMNNWLP